MEDARVKITKIEMPKRDENFCQVSLKGREVMICQDDDGTSYMRIPNSSDPLDFIDCKMCYYDLSVMLKDDDVVLRKAEDGSFFVDYSDQTLGR